MAEVRKKSAAKTPSAGKKEPAPKPPATKAAVTKKAAPRKKTAAPLSKPKAAASRKVVTPRERWHMISVAAYFLAEKRGFTGGDPAADWTTAERQIDEQFKREATIVKG